MKETYRILPVYAGDVSGIAGALYELGGMTVIHDPSGCNSTYNTHDELRWYSKPSAIFISGLNIRDAVLGNDRKFIRDILEAASSLPKRPAFIALCNSPLPWLNGTDFRAIAEIVERESGIPAFYVPSNGCHDYAVGAGRAFAALLRKFEGQLESERQRNSEKQPKSEGQLTRVNLIGMMPLDYGSPQCLPSLRKRMEQSGFGIQSVFAMTEGSSEELLQSILESSAADASLVLSVTGLPAAQYLERKFGVPYVVGVPLREENDPVLEELRKAAAGQPYAVCPHAAQAAAPETDSGAAGDSAGSVVIGEPVLAGSLASLLLWQTGRRVIVINPLEVTGTARENGSGRKQDAPRRLSAPDGSAISGRLTVPDGTAGPAGAGSFEGILSPGDRSLFGEEEMERGLSLLCKGEGTGGRTGADLKACSQVLVYCDPLYASILPEKAVFRPVPTLALSGRRYRKYFINWFCSKSVKELISDGNE